MRNVNDTIIRKRFNLRNEELETNLSKKIKKICLAFLDVILQHKKDSLVELFDDYENRHNYRSEKYYMTAFRNNISLLS